jgi:hypothetical protein
VAAYVAAYFITPRFTVSKALRVAIEASTEGDYYHIDKDLNL